MRRTTVRHHLRRRGALRAVALTATLALALAGCGTPSNRWLSVFGTLARSPSGSLSLRPAGRARAARQTFSALTVSSRSYREVQLRLQVRTLRQLRTPVANPWEVGWVLWDYSDRLHFYYLALKPNGWEIGKEDPAYPGAQRFLATGQQPRFSAGSWHTVAVSQHGAALIINVDGRRLASLVDRQRPYLAGKVGLYCEDAEALYRPLHLSGH